MKIQIEITEDEANMIGYALSEMANRRLEQSREQSIERGGARGSGAQQSASEHRELSNRIYDAAKTSLP